MGWASSCLIVFIVGCQTSNVPIGVFGRRRTFAWDAVPMRLLGPAGLVPRNFVLDLAIDIRVTNVNPDLSTFALHKRTRARVSQRHVTPLALAPATA